jgi:two-component system, chemotaxis family, protein-glutamate methylesterase/glutaminase
MGEQSGPAAVNGHPDLVVIGASAGGVETLKRVVSNLPADLDAALCIVLHIAPDSPSLLASILSRAGDLPCRPAADGDTLRPGCILVAPPDRHLVVEDDRVRLNTGPRENGHRPAVDVLFRTAATAKGRRVIGVVLSGTRGDGTAGLAAVKAGGGATIVQDPSEALYAGMPATALAHVAVDAVVPSELVARTIVAMVRGEDPPPSAKESRPETDPASGDPVTSVCPECGGVLSERLEAGVMVWECRVGHRYSPESLADAQADSVEAALWAAIRVLEDRSRLLVRMADQFDRGGHKRSARSFRRRAASALDQSQIVRRALEDAALSTLEQSPDHEPAHGDLMARGGGA